MKNTVLTIAVFLISSVTISLYAQHAPRETQDFLKTTSLTKSNTPTTISNSNNSSTQLINVSRDQKGKIVSIFALSENNKETEDVYGRSYSQIYKDILFAEDMAKNAKEINAKYANIIKDEAGNIIAFELKSETANKPLVKINLDHHANILNIEGPVKSEAKTYEAMYHELLSADMMLQVANELKALNGKVYRDDDGNIFAFEIKSKNNTQKGFNKEGIIL